MGNARSYHTRLRIENHTNTDIIKTSISGIDNYDWDGYSRPDHNFNGISINAKQSVEQREEVNARASHCPFTMTLQFRDGNTDTFRIHQRHAIGCCPGFQHMTRSHNIYYQRVGDNMLKISIESTEEQLQNEKAEQLNKEGVAAMKQQQYEAAMKKFDEAQKLAKEHNTIESIKSNKAQTCNEMGKLSLQKGCDLEADTTKDNSEEAQKCFDDAKSLFQQAKNLHLMSEYDNNLQMVNTKMEANRLFNEANELEGKAFDLFENARKMQKVDDFADAQNKYKEALNKYEQAKQKFEEGMKSGDTNFEICSKIVAEHIDAVLKVIDGIDKAEFNYNVNEVTVEENKKENSTETESQIDIKLEEQIDAVVD